jgi:hypothetical protein
MKTKEKKIGKLPILAAAGLSLSIILAFVKPAPADDLSTLRPERTTGFSNGGWNHDRYKDELEPLDAGKKIVIADLKGPGIITHIHTTRHRPAELFARGIVLQIWFDDAEQPAVLSPLGDFFGDGCIGGSMYFSTPLIECAPWSYNCYFPMPFEKRARVILRNDTERDTSNYSYVEWESLPEWDSERGYFHATYRRDVFQLNMDADHVFFEIEGSGHLIGRQYSVTQDEPLFRNFGYVMEGNNEVDVDGQERRLDYLGTEDSFTFSWGFRDPFAGLRAGMPLIDKGKDLHRLSMYRFHDYMPIRFNESLRWQINWSMERQFTNRDPNETHSKAAAERARRWKEALTRNGCWVDYATVYYWYQDRPGGFEHHPMRPVEQRNRQLLRSNKTAREE